MNIIMEAENILVFIVVSSIYFVHFLISLVFFLCVCVSFLSALAFQTQFTAL